MSSMTFMPAAHVTHAIAHSNAVMGMVVGAVAGAVVGAVITLATGGAGAPLVIGLAVAGGAVGKWLGSGSSSDSGQIKAGAATVFYGPSQLPAARITDPIECHDAGLGNADDVISGHKKAFINDGAFRVTIELKEAARIGDMTSCGGAISKGIESIHIGGATIGVFAHSELSEDNPYVEWTLWSLDWMSSVFGAGAIQKKAVALGIKAAKGVSKKALGEEHPITVTLGWAEAGWGIVGGGRSEIAKAVKDPKTAGKVGKEGLNTYKAITHEDVADLPLTPEMAARQAELRRTGVEPGGWFDKRPSAK